MLLPEDDASIAADTPCYRRINPTHHLVWDENRGCRRVSSGAFSDPEMSVALGDVLDALDRAPATVLDSFPDQFLVGFPTGVARHAGQRVIRDASPEEPAHGLVLGKKGNPVRRVLAAASTWCVRPEDGCPCPNGDDAPAA